LSVLAGPDPRDPACYPSEPSIFAQPLERSLTDVRVAWALDLGGLPVDRRILDVLTAQRTTFADLGCVVEDACPDLADADDIFLTVRRWRSWITLGPLLDEHRDRMKPEAISEIEAGAALGSADVARAMLRHGELLERIRRFFDRFEFLVCTATQLPAFDARIHWPREIDGVEMADYVAWMKSAYWISAMLCPAISVPAGFTNDGLPVGIQIVGRHRDDLGVLQLAHAFEQATGFGTRRPGI
jgi:amidase